jgi:aliphatic nitrilase
VLRRRKITPSFHERMVWGQGDGSGLRVVETALGRIGALACWENFNPLARAALMAQHEEIHCTHFPGSMVGATFALQIEAAVRHHAAEAGCFVVNATGWLTDAQVASIAPDPAMRKVLRGGTCSAIVSPEGVHLAPMLTEGEGMVIAELDMSLITKRKRMMDSVGHYARPDLLRLHVETGRQVFSNVTLAGDCAEFDRSDANDAGEADHNASDHRSAILRVATI